MRTAITLAYHKGGELVEMLDGPLTSIDVQRANFKQARQSKVHEQFERIELWESGAGCVLHHNYRDGIAVAQPPSEKAKAPEPTPVVPPPPVEPEKAKAPEPTPVVPPPPVEPEKAAEADEAEDAAEFDTGKASPAKPKNRR